MTEHTINEILTFLRRLESVRIDSQLTNTQPSAITVLVTVPGERWEVDFHQDGTVAVERFKSDGSILDERALDELFAKYSD